MKKILFILCGSIFMMLGAQETYNITWMMGISEEDASVTLHSEDTVIWTWGEPDMPHSVSSTDPDAPEDFGSEILTGEGQTYQYTFHTLAEIEYHCSVHPAMNGVITVLPILSVEDVFVKNLKYFPSVVSEKLTITSLVPLSSYEIYDAEGKKITEGDLDNLNVYEIDTSGFSSGVYVVTVESSTKVNTTFRIVKK